MNFIMVLILAALPVFALGQVLLPPLTMKLPFIGDTLTIQNADCSPSTNVIDTKIFNSSSTVFVGDVQLTVVHADRLESKSVRRAVISAQREGRLAFDFGKDICKLATELRLKSLPDR